MCEVCLFFVFYVMRVVGVNISWVVGVFFCNVDIGGWCGVRTTAYLVEILSVVFCFKCSLLMLKNMEVF